MESLEVAFEKAAAGRRYRSLLRRADGVEVAFEGGAYNKLGARGELPHDLAHLIVERELELTQGVWGVLAAGGLFRHATVVAGRQAPHAARRGRELVEAASDAIMQAELLTRVVCDACAAGPPFDPAALRRVNGEGWWSELVTRELVERCDAQLAEAARAWAALAPGRRLVERWPLARQRRPASRRGAHAR
ncbi:hypothetical protein Q5424_07050 [Conexibacter sp. JD483]|uniref:hypothetical protein n=1 Tax=unclassified Conexibacter TaxID=2627773 RepID=UPI00271E3D46|nr:MULTISPECIES: hypothetical protein [unclassified Conexibacter]MDO8186952.1 hypothetical protein [Conexibacter sp. CPCC 205706]MDO8200593.1 hypothetical protein [Conexibacter sp. CPCC 205762]MDR9368829.1 hypothetical protein [Conexibacter sp. JD483]